MRLLVAAILFAAATAHAQPRPAPCGVTFVRASDEVRHEIERWLAAEPRCATPLEVRVVPTDGGLYLWAQRPDGQVHERMVPDAQTAGVLVASWAADDWVDANQPVIAPNTAITPPPTLPAAPGRETSAVDAPPRAKAAHEGGAQWISVGAAMGDHKDAFGYRASIDVAARGPWRFGVAGQYSSAAAVFTMDPNATSAQDQEWLGGLRDSKLVATVSRGETWGGWELGGSVGVGLLYTSGQLGTVGPSGYESDVHKLVPVAEAEVMLTRHITRSVAFGFGPLATVIDETFKRSDAPTMERSEVLVQWHGAIRVAL